MNVVCDIQLCNKVVHTVLQDVQVSVDFPELWALMDQRDLKVSAVSQEPQESQVNRVVIARQHAMHAAQCYFYQL